jgi:hypothetical protein
MDSEIPRDDKGRCVSCGGLGKQKDNKFCACPIGRAMAEHERWDQERAIRGIAPKTTQQEKRAAEVAEAVRRENEYWAWLKRSRGNGEKL